MTNTTATTKNACQCRNFADATTGERLTCNAETARNFAPGHDARLKGHLIRIGRAGHLVQDVSFAGYGSDPRTAQQMANRYGFAAQVAAGIARVAKAPKAKAAPQPRKVTAKVGRWTYEGTLTESGKWFTYTDAKGKERASTKYTVISG